MDNLKSQMQYYAIVDGKTVLKTADVELEDYKRAANSGMSFKQYINAKCDDADRNYGDAFTQAVQAMGGASKVHGGTGTMSPTLAQLYKGVAAGPANSINMGSTITAPDGSDNTPAGRIFYPEIVMDMMRDSLLRDNSDIEGAFNSMIAVNENISGGVYIQPKINVTANENVPAQAITQGADPAVMVNITTSQVTRTIPTKSIGLQITDQAMQFATVDLVATAIAAQSRGERIRMVDNDINSVINGDVDAGFGALTAVPLSTYDSGLAAGQVSHKAFLKMLYADYQKLSIDSAIMDIDTYLAYENRLNRPTVDKNISTDDRLNAKMKPINFSLEDLNILIVDTAVLGAGNRALFLDSRFALRKVTDVTAQYEAVQAFVMRRMSQMRFDYGQHTTRLYDEAFKLIDLT